MKPVITSQRRLWNPSLMVSLPRVTMELAAPELIERMRLRTDVLPLQCIACAFNLKGATAPLYDPASDQANRLNQELGNELRRKDKAAVDCRSADLRLVLFRSGRGQ